MIQWTDGLSVGVQQIDAQHQKLVQLINDLHSAMGVGKGRQIAGSILKELVYYTVVHFALEEGIFKKYRYPAAVWHNNERKGFVKKISKFQKDFTNERLNLTFGMLTFLSDWLKEHIMKTDREYVPFFNARGLN